MSGDTCFHFQECLGILAARCASCNCMTYFYCAPLQVYTPFRSAQNHCPPDNVRPAGGYISWGIDSQLIYFFQSSYFSFLYSSSLTGSSHSVELFSPGTSIARCETHSSGAAPCQCLTPVAILMQSLGFISTASLPSS